MGPSPHPAIQRSYPPPVGPRRCAAREHCDVTKHRPTSVIPMAGEWAYSKNYPYTDALYSRQFYFDLMRPAWLNDTSRRLGRACFGPTAPSIADGWRRRAPNAPGVSERSRRFRVRTRISFPWRPAELVFNGRRSGRGALYPSPPRDMRRS